jgi:hypothetical protein
MKAGNIAGDRYPDIEFKVLKKKETLSGKIYLGFFMAFCIFLSIVFGNLLFTVLVVIISFFIMASNEDFSQETLCHINKSSIVYGSSAYAYKNIKYFSIVENEIENNQVYLKLSFADYITPNVYIALDQQVQKEMLYAIMSARLDENPSQKLSFVEMIILKFV